MYGIATSDRYSIKRVAGKIIPAIATTTATVAGLVSAQSTLSTTLLSILLYSQYYSTLSTTLLSLLLYSQYYSTHSTTLLTVIFSVGEVFSLRMCLLQVAIELFKLIRKASLEDYKNCFLNLALPAVVLSEPGAAKVTQIR